MTKATIVMACAIVGLAASNAAMFIRLQSIEQSAQELSPRNEHRIRMLEIGAEQRDEKTAQFFGTDVETAQLSKRIDALESSLRASQADTDRAFDDICVKSGYQACK